VPMVYCQGTALRTLAAGPVADSRTKVVVRGIRHRCMVVLVAVAVAEPDHSVPDPSAPSSPSAPSPSSPYSTVTLFARLRG
jgi:hypothetical protein